MPSTPAPLPKIETETMRRITWRLLPFFMLCYFISYVDRVNAGFAALQMNKDLRLTQAVFGAGGALFYIAYIVFEVPSNLAMQKVGARIWIARIMITWGLVGILSAERAGRALAVGTIDGEAGRPHVTVANPDQQICAHPRFDLCGELGDEQRVVAVAASDREIVRDVQHGDRLPECHPVWNRVGRDDRLGKIFGQIKRPRSKHRNTACVVRNSAACNHAHELIAGDASHSERGLDRQLFDQGSVLGIGDRNTFSGDGGSRDRGHQHLVAHRYFRSRVAAWRHQGGDG